MAAKGDPNSELSVQKDAGSEARKDRLETFRRKKSIAEKSNLHLRELDGNTVSAGADRKPTRRVKGERSSASLASTHAVSNAVTEFHWRSCSARKIDFSKELERGLPTITESGQVLYILGAEFAITAIVAAAAIARRRADMSSATLPSVAKLKSDAEKEKHFSTVKIILKDGADCEGNGRENATDSFAQSMPTTEENVADALAGSAHAGDKSKQPGKKSTKPGDKGVPAGADGVPVAEARNAYLYGSSTSRPTAIITRSDTLVSIAQRQYHDGNVGWLIADLNRAKIKEKFDDTKRVVEITDGEQLELPIWKEIVAFYQRKEEGACAENLITIVSRRNIDKEIVDAVLSPIVAPPEDD